jgi:hypothetical protein
LGGDYGAECSAAAVAPASPSCSLLRTLLASTALVVPVSAQAQDAIWRGGVDANWNQGGVFSGSFNWGSVASGGMAAAPVPTNTAFFPDNPNNRYAVFFGQPSTSIQTLQFTSTEAYSFFLVNQRLDINGTGIVNTSPVKPKFATSVSGTLTFNNSSTAANAIILNNLSGVTFFNDSSSAATATITNSGGNTVFATSATAADAIINAGAATRTTTWDQRDFSTQASPATSYTGQIASNVRDHGVKGNFTWTF